MSLDAKPNGLAAKVRPSEAGCRFRPPFCVPPNRVRALTNAVIASFNDIIAPTNGVIASFNG
ncbi:MAG: hypothetical protein KDM63_21770, partial [Verrucomicrobiae bacterium]|nr:hypothetical protein [Verrucomicrobiae bacterium]